MAEEPFEIPEAIRALCEKVTAKRPRTVIDHILIHGYVTTEELKEQYGYDHRIPYQVTGEPDFATTDAFMLLDASTQRAKSWSCEQCENFNNLLDPGICRRCFWAFPEDYDHVAMKPERRLYLVWQGQETEMYDALDAESRSTNEGLQSLVKQILIRHVLKR